MATARNPWSVLGLKAITCATYVKFGMEPVIHTCTRSVLTLPLSQ